MLPTILNYRSRTEGEPRSDRQVLRQLAGLLAVLTAVACAVQVYGLAMWGVWGASPDPRMPCGLFGGFALFLSALPLVVMGRRWAAVPPVLACGVLWVFYGPAVVNTLDAVRAGGLTLSSFALVPAELLAVATLAVVLAAAWPCSAGEAESARRAAAASRPDPWLSA